MPRKPASAKAEDTKQRPAKRRAAVPRGLWRLPPLAWILNGGRFGRPVPAPSRILCATLPEAFLLAASLKETEVVALDSSAELVKAGRTAASRRRLRNLRIEQAELGQAALGELVGGNFDVVLAHDVLHCVRDADAAFANLAAACAENGAVYVSVRSTAHPSARLDAGLAAFGLERCEITEDNKEAESVAKMLAGLGGFLPAHVLEFSRELQGEGTGAAPLAAWLDRAGAAGLHLRATTLTAKTLTSALGAGGTKPLSSFPLSKMAVFLDKFLAPSSVELVFSREAVAEIPWSEPDRLLSWRPISRFLPLAKLPEMQEPWNGLAGIEVEIHGVLAPQNFTLSHYLVELIRRSDGTKNLAELMAEIPHETEVSELVGALHFLHHSFILELQTP